MADIELTLADPEVETKFYPTVKTHEQILVNGDTDLEIKLHFDIPVGKTRKIKITASLVGPED